MKACGGEQAQGLCESWFGLGGVELVGAFRTLVLIEHVSEDAFEAARVVKCVTADSTNKPRRRDGR